MKILIYVLGCHTNIDGIRAVLNTWGKNLPDNISLYIVGNRQLVSLLPDQPVIDCSVDGKDNRDIVPSKIYNALDHAMTVVKDWDFILKCDDDTYVNIQALMDFVRSISPDHDQYIGHACYWRDGTHYLTDIGPSLTEDQIKSTDYYYAQGGTGYIVSKSTLEKAWNNLTHYMNNNIPHPLKHPNEKKKWAVGEDLALGHSMRLSNVKLNSRPDLFDAGDMCNQWPSYDGVNRITRRLPDNHVDQIVKYNKITTHHVEPGIMHRIYNEKNNKKILVATGYYYECSSADKAKQKPTNVFRGQVACKYVEFFDLWYKHVRKYVPGADIFVLDNGSPLPFLSNRGVVDNNIIVMNDKLHTQNDTGLFTYRYDNKLDHHTGWCRQLLTILKFARKNNYDTLYYIESDALIGFDPFKYDQFDFVCPKKWQSNGCEQNFMKITKSSFDVIEKLEDIYNKIINVKHKPDLYYPNDKHHLYLEHFAENGTRKYFWDQCTNPSYLDKDDMFIHDVDEHQLNEFLNYSNV